MRFGISLKLFYNIYGHLVRQVPIFKRRLLRLSRQEICMKKKVLTLESLHKSTLNSGYFAIVFMDIVGFGLCAAVSYALETWLVAFVAALVLIAFTIYMIKKQNEFKDNPPDYIVMEDTATRLARVVHGRGSDKESNYYLWFEDLNKYHNYGWIRPSLYYMGMPRAKYYLIKEEAGNDILFTYETSKYELGEDLKLRLQPVADVYMDSGKKGREFDETRTNVYIKELV